MRLTYSRHTEPQNVGLRVVELNERLFSFDSKEGLADVFAFTAVSDAFHCEDVIAIW